jgi:hypothetical protein
VPAASRVTSESVQRLIGHHHHLPRRRDLAVWSLLVLGLIVTHLALMTTERHAEVMGPLHAAFGTIGMASPGIAEVEAPGHQQHAPAAPDMVFGNCPAQQAVFPALLLLLFLAATIALISAPGDNIRRALNGRVLTLGQPPPLAPAQRRALLQVFLI